MTSSWKPCVLIEIDKLNLPADVAKQAKVLIYLLPSTISRPSLEVLYTEETEHQKSRKVGVLFEWERTEGDKAVIFTIETSDSDNFTFTLIEGKGEFHGLLKMDTRAIEMITPLIEGV